MDINSLKRKEKVGLIFFMSSPSLDTSSNDSDSIYLILPTRWLLPAFGFFPKERSCTGDNRE